MIIEVGFGTNLCYTISTALLYTAFLKFFPCISSTLSLSFSGLIGYISLYWRLYLLGIFIVCESWVLITSFFAMVSERSPFVLIYCLYFKLLLFFWIHVLVGRVFLVVIWVCLCSHILDYDSKVFLSEYVRVFTNAYPYLCVFNPCIWVLCSIGY